MRREWTEEGWKEIKRPPKGDPNVSPRDAAKAEANKAAGGESSDSSSSDSKSK